MAGKDIKGADETHPISWDAFHIRLVRASLSLAWSARSITSPTLEWALRGMHKNYGKLNSSPSLKRWKVDLIKQKLLEQDMVMAMTEVEQASLRGSPIGVMFDTWTPVYTPIQMLSASLYYEDKIIPYKGRPLKRKERESTEHFTSFLVEECVKPLAESETPARAPLKDCISV
ncbi:hypothetical protein Pmar_PMAR019721 [Perkinsus marinus ATCC 50983]|uniref:Uncharacterized protein n=1 Tax=Perkinsus marinus (strain ATCC 50983 / TXsc) TaxID=423536 RepID=C5LW03_PERM5|nr:hypothetical protein Pmar_PMAR019721 [Perkinsus marinus ATCC 50983]EEQ99073.1 hypothetical protein Pmar_PMAR019721 [Perkinsus marinus ATCC 50983]|eukprot:XP_002766356.1 hypothetical protein Pmar_PMAR019721 [Perkinsus marinus ATCC 50983]